MSLLEIHELRRKVRDNAASEFIDSNGISRLRKIKEEINSCPSVNEDSKFETKEEHLHYGYGL